MNRLLILLLYLFIHAESGFASEAQPSAGFGFSAPEVVKLDWSTRSLSAADLDGDGRQDLAVINNDAGKIELLYQLPQGEAARAPKKSLNRGRWEPVLEDARFEKRSLTVGFPVFDLVVRDLNADGRVDLAYTSGEMPLTIRYQNEAGEWVDSSEYDGFEALGWADSIKASDVDGDGSVELFVLASDAIRVFRHGAKGKLSEPELYYTSGENPFNMMLFDATGDGLSDLLYLSNDGKQVMAMREQVEGGEFGPERRHVMERPARMVLPLQPSGAEAPALGVVNSRSGSLEFMRLASRKADESGTGSALDSGSPEIYPIFNKIREAASYALGDVNGDGEQDLVVANPAEAKLVLFAKAKGRFQVPREFPSFSKVSSLAVGRFNKTRRESLVVLSEAEKTVGRSYLDSGGRLTFPRQMQVGGGDPVVASAGDVNGDGYDELLLVTQDEGSYRLVVAAPLERGVEEGPWDVLFDAELAGVRRQPTAIATMDVFASGLPGLIIFVPREPPVLLRPSDAKEDVSFLPVATESSIRESLLKGISPAAMSVFDVDRDGLNELVVARTGFARAFKIVDGQLEMVDQFNARRGRDVIDAVIPLRASGSEGGRIALYVSETREVQFLQREADGVYRYDKSIKVGRLKLQNWYRLPASEDAGGEAYLFAGEDRFWCFNHTSPASNWVIEGIYETDLEDIHYSHLASTDFNQDKRVDLVALDGSEHVVDILSFQGDEFASQMFWQVFEQNMHYQGRTGAKLEPREIVIDDFTGDGLPDLGLLVHDRILIYPQE